jgi:AraC-like DNA-binding protein
MDYFCFIQSVVSYVENRLKTDIDCSDIVRATGFSLPHTRDVFKKCTRMSLTRYILYRRVSNAAFEIAHTGRSMLDIALDYGFDSYDTFTRAFRRITGTTPREFRRNGSRVGRVRLTGGVYGPGLGMDTKTGLRPLPQLEEIIGMKSVKKSDCSCILYGVPKVEYKYGECTPFPSSLKACLNYMGQEISYSYLMAASGASFRLRWNTSCWDGGNVDIMCIYENPLEAFERSFKAAGRSFRILGRKPEITKNDFKAFIKSEIDEGRPVIALGIIGPPEACIVTGYRDDGDTLLGWNFFQENPEFAKDVRLDESGYFICGSWWENPNTIGLMSVGEESGPGTALREILQNAAALLDKERIGNYAGGQAAFDAWAKALSDESQFPKNAVLPLLFERLMCQNDAMTMIGEGRSYAAFFMEWVGEQHEELKNECRKAAGLFREEFSAIAKMSELLDGWLQGEQQARKLAEPDVREKIVKLIMAAKQYDAGACELIKGIVLKI